MNINCSKHVLRVIAAATLMVTMPVLVAQADSLRELSDAFARVAENVKPSVVSVISEKELTRSAPWFFNDSPLFREFFGDMYRQRNGSPRQEWKETVRGLGSGVIIDGKEGYVLTNNHVVTGADKLKILLADKREFTAEVKGADPRTDIAILQIVDKDGPLPQAVLGRSEHLRVGDWVVAIGSPYGLSQTVTAGIVSATGRGAVIPDPSVIQDFIQTDAAINRGNSGGPLVNLDGEVIGINTAIASRSGGYEGIGFAIPIEMVQEVKDQLIETGKVTRGMLGIRIQDVDRLAEDVRKSLKIDVDYGAYVEGVVKDTPAEEAGIRPGDVIVEFKGKRIEDSRNLQKMAAATAPGTKVKLVVLRDGSKKKLSVTLGEMADDMSVVQPQKVSESNLGMTVEKVTPQLAKRFGIDEDSKGVVVTGVAPEGPAARAGLKTGSVILEVNRESVETVKQFEKALDKSKETDSVLLLVQQEGVTRLVSVKLN